MKATTNYPLKQISCLLLLTLWVIFLLPTTSLLAQTTDNSYWRYAAARRLTHVIPADINNDGIAEFLVAAENGKIDLLNAHNAALEWSYDAGGIIQALNSINIDGPENPEREVMLVTENLLILLDHTGSELWRIELIDIDPTTNRPLDIEFNLETYIKSDLDAQQIAAIDEDGDGREEIAVYLRPGSIATPSPPSKSRRKPRYPRLTWRRCCKT
jgi:outer membrane protein assembly factor BamB